LGEILNGLKAFIRDVNQNFTLLGTFSGFFSSPSILGSKPVCLDLGQMELAFCATVRAECLMHLFS
jgi:hypothetical protein